MPRRRGCCDSWASPIRSDASSARFCTPCIRFTSKSWGGRPPSHMPWPCCSPSFAFTRTCMHWNAPVLITAASFPSCLWVCHAIHHVYMRYRSSDDTSSRLVGLYVCSVMSKSAAILVPVGIVATDIVLSTPPQPCSWNRRATTLALLRYAISKAGYGVSMLGLACMTAAANADGAMVDTDILHLSMTQRCVKAVVVLLWPVRKLLWPTPLRYHYQLPSTLHASWIDSPLWLLSATATAGITTWCIVRARRTHSVAALAAWTFYLAMLLPVSGLVQHGLVVLAADRYVYFPAIVVVPVVGQLFTYIDTMCYPWNRTLAVVSLCAVALCLAHVATLQLESWRTAEAVFRHGLKSDPTDWRILDQLQELLLETRPAEATLYLQQTLRYSPRHGLKAQLQIAKCHMLLGQSTEACAIYESLHEQYPTYAHVLNNMGICHWKQGRLRAARDLFVRAAANGTGLTRGDQSPQTNIILVDAWDPRTPVVARIMW
ncbi:hypothetical protein, variant [Aphanomyces astaci]|uniref:Uncharacterized protein n=1 Tax=Aphanomyces astaci TaxID=112090 RepID=W4G7B5_APHAT|nr:hypothetical protein, variant [Aphanomyces astaci]ETV74959.1 hypothetical protein, variant [Aphanomyces astaci]|eukprot:XP_009835462.1 hypothetical protein, variant [Aphanomyces astaci]